MDLFYEIISEEIESAIKKREKMIEEIMNGFNLEVFSKKESQVKKLNNEITTLKICRGRLLQVLNTIQILC